MERIVTQTRFVKTDVARPKRVAAYARVSSGKDAMLHSLSAQVSYYSKLIQNHGGWEYAGVYADEALTGTKDNRENFQRLLADCRSGKVDLILTKSVSRFARNTLTLLETVRELKSLGVDVYFEEQNIHSATSDGELMLTILASYAQEESLSASENQKWRVRQQFQNGKPWRGFMMGYRYDGEKYVIVPEEAEVVRSIFRDYLDGKGVAAIMKRLNEEGILTQQGYTWHQSAVSRILRNYAYTGNLLLQTKFRENHLTKRTLVNHGELPQYHAENTHEPIIDIDTYNLAQLEMARRAERFAKPQTKTEYPFTGLITCAGCGKHYRRKVTKTDPVWICATYNTLGKKFCPSKAIPEPTLMAVAAEICDFSKITAITADKDNTLIFTLVNGETIVKRWKDRSRSESWTPEMRAAVGKKTKKGASKMATAKNVTVIPATRNLHTGVPMQSKSKRKVAGYARVSTDSDEQFTSYEAQVDYYTNYIKSRPEWEFVEVYTDEGISALNTKKRDGFNRMIADALNGKIDLIVTKSVSRFARNTVDSLTTVRRLKDKGVEVYFEKENIWTMDSKGELLITIMSSLAQEESRSISENVTWGQRKRFADGKVSMPYKQFLGYKKGVDGLPEIVPEEAEIIRTIYRMFIEGTSTGAIAKHLTDSKIPTPAGKAVWQRHTIESILQNEKYKGSALLQKKYTVDFLQKKMKVNEGEVPQYYVEHSHPAIIASDEWERVQLELKRRKGSGRRTISTSPFAGKLICGDCGEIFGSKVWHSNSKYRRTIWQCNAKFKGDTKCTTPHLYEDDIKELFVVALSKLMVNREALLEDGRLIRHELMDTAAIDNECEELLQEMDVVAGLIQKCVNENAVQTIDQDEYISHYNALVERHEKAQSRYDTLQKKRERRLLQADVMSGFLSAITELDTLQLQFNPTLWHTTVDHVTVYADECLEFHFMNGIDVEVRL